MFYVVKFLVNLILAYLCLTLSGIPQEYYINLGVVMFIMNIAGYIEGVIQENTK